MCITYHALLLPRGSLQLNTSSKSYHVWHIKIKFQNWIWAEILLCIDSAAKAQEITRSTFCRVLTGAFTGTQTNRSETGSHLYKNHPFGRLIQAPFILSKTTPLVLPFTPSMP